MTTTLETATDLPELRFTTPVPGLEQLTRFALVRLDDEGALFRLQSLEAEDVRLVVLAPTLWFPDYAPVVEEEDVADLGLGSAEDALLLVVVSPGDSLATSTANLLAPIVVHARTGASAQVVLAGSDHPLRAPLLP